MPTHVQGHVNGTLRPGLLPTGSGSGPAGDALLLEGTADGLLLESADFLLLEGV